MHVRVARHREADRRSQSKVWSRWDRLRASHLAQRCGGGLSRWRWHGRGFRRGFSSQRIGGAGTQCRDGTGDDE
eukprot:185365-Pleurochrysis_carterae.AAC.1